jgi:hypothetical protein
MKVRLVLHINDDNSYYVFDNIPEEYSKMLLEDNDSFCYADEEDTEAQKFVNDDLVPNLEKYDGREIDCKEFCDKKYNDYQLLFYNYCV